MPDTNQGRRDQGAPADSLPEDRTCRVAFTAYDVQISGGLWTRFRYYPAVAICTDGVVVGQSPRELPGVDQAADAFGIHHKRLLADSVQDNLAFVQTKLSNWSLKRAFKTHGDHITSRQILDALGSKPRLIPIEHVTKVTLTPLKGRGGKSASVLMEFEAPDIGRFASRAPRETSGYLEDELRALFGNRLVIRSWDDFHGSIVHPERG